MKKFLGTLGLIIFGFGLALIVAGGAITIMNYWFPYFYCYDRERGWGLDPGAEGTYGREGGSFVRINHDGFRGPDYARTKAPDTIRVAVLGDSYVEAIQVPETLTFTAVVGRELSQCPRLKGRRVEALNFGVDGYGTAQELITLQRRVWAYSPEVVVLAIFLGNDIRNNSVALEGDRCRPFFALDGNGLKLAGPLINSDSFRLWCAARFGYRDARLLELFGDAWEILKNHRGAPTAEEPAERAINYDIYKPPTDAVWRDAWDVTERLIVAVNNEVKAHGAIFLAVTEDTGIQVWPIANVTERFAHHLGAPDLFYPDRRIAALGQREGFAVLTLAQPLQQYAIKNQVFLHGFSNTPPGSGHWNKLGHAEAGRLIAQRLCSMIQGGNNRDVGRRGETDGKAEQIPSLGGAKP
jgi:hypothetical protein